MRQRLKTAHRPDAPALLCAGLGALLFLAIYGPSTLNVRYDSWIFAGYINTDVMQHYAGWAAFRAGGWAFPLCFTQMLSYPFGGVAALADIIPLFALPAKLLSPLLPETFQYFGWFVLFSMAMGGWAGARLLGLFGLSGAGRVLGGALFAASPVLLERAFQHTALSAQWLVVLALYFYFKYRRCGYEKWPWGYVPLCAAAVLVHAYFVPMVLALAFAAAVDGWLNARSGKGAVMLAAGLAAAGLWAFLLGYFTKTDYVPGGYGNFGLNLNAFFNPVSFNWGIWAPGYRHLDWSRILPALPSRGDTLEGFNYLGAGVLAALLAGGAAFALRGLRRHGAKAGLRRAGGFALRHLGLAAACLCLLGFAVSNVVSANSRVLLEIPLPEALLRLCDTFRSSGRMAWPVYHLLTLCAVLGAARLWPPRRPSASALGVTGRPDEAGHAVARAVARGLRRREGAGQAAAALTLALLLAIQGFDLSGVLAEKHAAFAAPVVPESYAAPEGWLRIARKGEALYQLELNEDRPTALRAALAGMKSNFFLLARGSQSALLANMAVTREHLLEGRLPRRGEVYITSNPALAAALRQSLAGLCEVVEFGNYTAFVPKWEA